MICDRFIAAVAARHDERNPNVGKQQMMKGRVGQNEPELAASGCDLWCEQSTIP